MKRYACYRKIHCTFTFLFLKPISKRSDDWLLLQIFFTVMWLFLPFATVPGYLKKLWMFFLLDCIPKSCLLNAPKFYEWSKTQKLQDTCDSCQVFFKIWVWGKIITTKLTACEVGWVEGTVCRKSGIWSEKKFIWKSGMYEIAETRGEGWEELIGREGRGEGGNNMYCTERKAERNGWVTQRWFVVGDNLCPSLTCFIGFCGGFLISWTSPCLFLIFVLKTWQEFENWRGKDLWVSFPKRILSSIVSPEGIPHFRCVQISEIVLFVKSYMIPTIRRSCVVQSTDWNNRAGCEHGQTRKLSIIWLGQRIWRMECQVSYQGLCEKRCMINMRIKEWPFHLYFTIRKVWKNWPISSL